MRGNKNPPTYKEVIVDSKKNLKSNDFFQIKTKINEAAFYYFLLWDSNQKITKLGSGKAIPEEIFILPGNNQWYQLDDTKGIESIIIITSGKEIPDFDNKLNKISSIETEELKKIFKFSNIELFQIKHE